MFPVSFPRAFPVLLLSLLLVSLFLTATFAQSGQHIIIENRMIDDNVHGNGPRR